MSEAWIIDACRTPRGIGKVGKGALAELHPQRLAATVLKAIAKRNDLNTAEVDDVIWGTSQPARQAGRRSRPHGRARCGLRHQGERHDARPLLRLGHHRRQSRGGLDHVGHGRSGRRRRHGDDVLHVVDGRSEIAAVHGRGQPASARAASAVASGRLRRRHRDAGRHPAPGARRAGAGQPAARRRGHQGRPFRQEPRARLSRRRHARARPRGIPAPADDARRPCRR